MNISSSLWSKSGDRRVGGGSECLRKPSRWQKATIDLKLDSNLHEHKAANKNDNSVIIFMTRYNKG